MTTSKKQLLESSNITDQEALVKKLLPTGPRIVKHVIPAGKTMFNHVDKRDMEGAVYNWLRACGGFTEVTLSFAKDPSQWVLAPVKVQSFDTRDPRPLWTRTARGRKDLAKEIAVLINDTSRRIVYITVKPDGIYAGEDKKGAFQSRVIVTEENQDLYPNKTIGDKVASVDWEPYIEFVASSRSRYTNYETPAATKQ